VQNHFAGSVLPSLSALDIKDVAGFMVAVVIKFELLIFIKYSDLT